jgi:homoserine O-acetyltransferase
MADYEVFELGDIVLQCGITLPRAKLAYKTYGKLSASCDNAVVMPTFYGSRHVEAEAMMGTGRALDPARLFIIVPNMFGNGLSSSPSNTSPPFDRAVFPNVTLYDNVVCQHRLVTEHLGIDRLRLIVGFSMGAQQAFQWGALYPELVQAIAPLCGSARTSPHNYLFLEGVKAALTADAAFADVGIKRRRSKDYGPSAAYTRAGRSRRISFASRSTVNWGWLRWKMPYDSLRDISGATTRMICWRCSGHGSTPTLVPIAGTMVILPRRWAPSGPAL